MQKTLDAIISENKSAPIKNRTIVHILSTIWDVTDVLNKLNNTIALISLNVLCKFLLSDVYSAQCKFGYGGKFIHMIEANLQSNLQLISNLKL